MKIWSFIPFCRSHAWKQTGGDNDGQNPKKEEEKCKQEDK